MHKYLLKLVRKLGTAVIIATIMMLRR